jgi:hypothetical protein
VDHAGIDPLQRGLGLGNCRGDEQAHISVPDAYLRPGGHLLGVSLEERQETTSSPAHFLYQVSGSGGAETIIGPAQSAH